ncbi:MAG: FHA domain-containing protein [Lachnospiraceae bacterium]|nr:FHA domain-containing protein [Lachnospiraceae bacterium]
MGLNRCKNGHMYSARKYGDTCPYCNTEMDRGAMTNTAARYFVDDPDKTMPLMDVSTGGVDPVTGWLVCIEGPQYGKDFKIKAGKNFMGRADNMQIQILGDNAISRVNHAAIIYDHKNRSTFLMPGDSQGLVYLNNEAVYAPTELHQYSLIELGRSKFIFIPLCGEHFEWEDNGNQDNDVDMF